MRSDYLPDDLKRLWKELALNPVEISQDDLRREARKLRSGVRLRNSFVVLVCLIIIAAYAFFAVLSKTTLERAGAVLSIAGAINVIVQFRKRPASKMPQADAIESIRFYFTPNRRRMIEQAEYIVLLHHSGVLHASIAVRGMGLGLLAVLADLAHAETPDAHQ